MKMCSQLNPLVSDGGLHCTERILDQEDALKLHFSLQSDSEHCYSARILNEMYSDKSNILYMHFLQPVLKEKL